MTQQTVPQQQSANDVLMGGGPSVPGFKFADPGDSITGRITAPPSTYQVREYDPNNPGGGALKFYPSGDPIMGLYVDLDTGSKDPMIEGDDGIRRIYIDGRYVKEAVREAVIAAGAQGLQPGGVLQLTFTHREDPMDKRSRKFWQAAYTPAGNAALMGQQTTPQQAAPAQQAPPQQGNNVVQGQFGGQQPPQAPQAQQGYQLSLIHI